MMFPINLTLVFIAAQWVNSIAQTTFDFAPLINMGAIGIVLAWMLWKAEPRMRAVERAIDDQTRAILILMLEIERTTPQAKQQAQIVLNSLDAARRERGEEAKEK